MLISIMAFFFKIFYVLFFIGLGYLIIKYRIVIKGLTGDWFWAEKRLGRGGTYLILILFGLLLIFYGALYPFGGLDLIFQNKHEIGNLQNTENGNVEVKKL